MEIESDGVKCVQVFSLDRVLEKCLLIKTYLNRDLKEVGE